MTATPSDDLPDAKPQATPEAEGPAERTLRIDLEYDGTDFEGWQRQSRGRTVQGEVEAALGRLLGAPHTVIGCGRTDSGVHAEHYVASARTQHDMPAADLRRALDAVLPPDVGVLDVQDASREFHAQKSAVWKWYRYRILVSPRKHPLRRRRVWRTARVPPLEALEAGAAALCGRHDFRSFANTGSTPGSTVRTVHALTWSRAGDEVHLDAVGDGFLYKMVRTLVGTLLREAQAPDPASRVTEILAARERPAAGPVAAASGLSLMAVALRGEEPPMRLPEMLRSSVDLQSHRSTGGHA